MEFTWAVLGHPVFSHCLPTGVAGCWDGQARSHLGLCLCAPVPVLLPSLSAKRGGVGQLWELSLAGVSVLRSFVPQLLPRLKDRI